MLVMLKFPAAFFSGPLASLEETVCDGQREHSTEKGRTWRIGDAVFSMFHHTVLCNTNSVTAKPLNLPSN